MSLPVWLAGSWLGSLRVRLAAAMLLVLVIAVAAAGALDEVRVHLSPMLDRVLDTEPVQDGLVLGCFAAAVLALIWGVSAWSLRPLERAGREARLAGPEHPGLRISMAGLPTEMRPLVESFNGALDRLEAAYEGQRRFTADAAHELRTPLSILSLRLAQAREEAPDRDAPAWHAPVWNAIDGDVRQMTRLVANLLDLARKEQAVSAAPLPVNLSRVAREAAGMVLPLAEASGRCLEAELPDVLRTQGRPGDLRDAVVNLLENALLHGAGTIRLSGRQEEQHCVLAISDEGPGVPEAQREKVFERFAKLDAASGGTGLGLAIVRQVAAAHGGTVCFAGTGAQVVLRLPAAEAGKQAFSENGLRMDRGC